MPLSIIRLELARDHDFPQGSNHHGYEFIAPLDDSGHIEAVGWKEHSSVCRVKRFWGSTEDEVGHLVRKPGGAWAFHYDVTGDADDDETGYRFQSHAFELGEYVSIKEHDDVMRTFRVVLVQDAPEHVDTLS